MYVYIYLYKSGSVYVLLVNMNANANSYIQQTVEAMRSYIAKRDADYAFISVPLEAGAAVDLEYERVAGNKDNVEEAWSVTKTFAGLCLADDYVKGHLNDLDLTRDLLPFIEIYAWDAEDKIRSFKQGDTPGPGIIHYMNHVSGIITGERNGDLKSTTEEDFYKECCGRPGLWDFLNSATTKTKTFGDALNGVVHGVSFHMFANKVFSYNNYGSLIAAYFYTAFRSHKKFNPDVHTTFMPAFELMCKVGKDKGFFPPEMKVLWDSRVDINNNYSLGYRGLHLSGSQMVTIAQLLHKTHLSLLTFIRGDSVTRPPNNYVVVASQDNVSVGQQCNNKNVDKYSFGMWLPQITGKRYVSAIGLFGQYMLIDIDSGMIAVRRKYGLALTNHHDTFILDVSVYQDTLINLVKAPNDESREQILDLFKVFLNKELELYKNPNQ
jgi:hypothetical protein